MSVRDGTQQYTWICDNNICTVSPACFGKPCLAGHDQSAPWRADSLIGGIPGDSRATGSATTAE